MSLSLDFPLESNIQRKVSYVFRESDFLCTIHRNVNHHTFFPFFPMIQKRPIYNRGHREYYCSPQSPCHYLFVFFFKTQSLHLVIITPSPANKKNIDKFDRLIYKFVGVSPNECIMHASVIQCRQSSRQSEYVCTYSTN